MLFLTLLVKSIYTILLWPHRSAERKKAAGDEAGFDVRGVPIIYYRTAPN